MLEARIRRLEDLVVNSRIIDESRIDTSSVQILNKVKIKNSQKDELIKKITDEFKESLAEAEAGNTIKTGKAVVLNAKI